MALGTNFNDIFDQNTTFFIDENASENGLRNGSHFFQMEMNKLIESLWMWEDEPAHMKETNGLLRTTDWYIYMAISQTNRYQ